MQVSQTHERRLSRWTVTTGAWILAAVLVVTIALIFSSREEQAGFPSITNVRASGYAGFADLLRRDGYEVLLERGVRPEFKEGDVVVCVTRPYFNKEEDEPSFVTAMLEPHRPQIEKHLKDGGRVIEIINWSQFERASNEARGERTVVSATDPDDQYVLSLPYNPFELTTLEVYEAPYQAWFIGDSSYIDYTAVGDGVLVTIGEGLPLTNRFLDQAQNAEFFLRLVRSVANEGNRIVFDESGIGNAEAPTVANTLGKWAVYARWQAMVLFAVLLFTLGRRFGLPELDRRSVRGSRELFDAISDVLRRTGNTGLALDNIILECDQRLRRVLGAPTTMGRGELLQRAPDEVRQKFHEVAELANANAPAHKSTKAAKELLETVETYESESRSKRSPAP